MRALPNAFIACCTGLCLAACAQLTATAPAGSAAGSAPARGSGVDADVLIVDTHIDVPFRLHRRPADLTLDNETGEFDYPKARSGGLDAAFMSIYIPAAVDAAGEAASLADKLIDDMEALEAAAPDKFALAHCADDIDRAHALGRIALPLGMENGGPIAGDLDNLRHFYARGIRYITLTHSKVNHISDSSYDTERRWNGLSPFGIELVRAMNAVGIMIDVSHVSDEAFWQVLEHSKTPVIASHSSLRHFTPGFERNMSDDMVKALGAAGGVIQINFGSSFLTQAARDWSNAQRDAFLAWQGDATYEPIDPRVVEWRKTYRQQNPYPYATLDDVLDHIDRAVDIAGIDAVGLGSDFDGVGDSLPVDLKHAGHYSNLLDGLRQRGYSASDIEKIASGNLLRVWRQVENHAVRHGSALRCRIST